MNESLKSNCKSCSYLLYRQIRKDIFDENLFVPETALPRLLGYILQADFSDWNEQLPENYATEIQFKKIPLSKHAINQAIETHKSLE